MRLKVVINLKSLFSAIQKIPLPNCITGLRTVGNLRNPLYNLRLIT